jgi:choice-of-anchor A domain-containing protein
MPSVRFVRLCSALCISLFACGGAQAGLLNLSQMTGGANVYAFRDFTSAGSDVEGALLAGGNVKLNSYSVNALNRDAFGASGYALVAGGDLTLTSGSINQGLAYVGGKTTLVSAAAPAMSESKPVDFGAAQAYYTNLSTALTKTGVTGSATGQWGGVKLTGSGKGGVDVFNVSSSLFQSSTWWQLQDLMPGETLVFNVSGKAGGFNNGNFGFDALSGYNVLFNFYEATTVNVNSVIGSILAPYATVQGGNGVVRGNVIADAWMANTQIDADHYFKPVEVAGLAVAGAPVKAAASKVPEPGSIALVLGGLALAGMVRRRGRQAPRRG